jgi:hypothetical protein
MRPAYRPLPSASRAGQSRLGTLILVIGLLALSFAGGAFAKSVAQGQIGPLLAPTDNEACTGEAHQMGNGSMRLVCEVANQDVCTKDDGGEGSCKPSTATPTAVLPGQLGATTFKYCACEGQAQGDCCQVVIKELNGASVGPVSQGSCLQALGCASQNASFCLLSYAKQNDPPFSEVWKATCLGKF